MYDPRVGGCNWNEPAKRPYVYEIKRDEHDRLLRIEKLARESAEPCVRHEGRVPVFIHMLAKRLLAEIEKGGA